MARFAEKALGWQAGFLDAGYCICLLAEPLRKNHVRFGGGTQYSAGRMGLPKETRAEDEARPFVHDVWATQHEKSIGQMIAAFCRDKDNLHGFRRLIKIFTAARAAGTNPALEFPPGWQAPQYILDEKHKFFVAAKISPSAVATTAAGWTVSITPQTPALERRKLYLYLQDLKIPV